MILTSPAPDEQGFNDYILITQIADIPAIYVYLSEVIGDNGEEKPPSIKVVNDKFLKNNNIDAHQIKKDFLGSKAEIKHYDIYMDKDSGQLWIFRKGGKGEGIPTGEFINK